MTPILSVTFDPPSTMISGRSGPSRTLVSSSTSRSSSSPAWPGRCWATPCGRRVGAVGGPEGVVHVELGQRRQGLRQLGVVLGLPLLEAAVLEHHHVAVGRGPRPSPRPRGRRRRARARRRRPSFSPSRSATGFIDSDGVLAVGPAQVRDQDDRALPARAAARSSAARPRSGVVVRDRPRPRGARSGRP